MENVSMLLCEQAIILFTMVVLLQSLHAEAPRHTIVLDSYTPSQKLRPSDAGLLSLPNTSLQTFCDQAFNAKGAICVNAATVKKHYDYLGNRIAKAIFTSLD